MLRFGRVAVIQMCFKSPKLVILNFYAQVIPREFFVDTTYIYVHTYNICVPLQMLKVFR